MTIYVRKPELDQDSADVRVLELDRPRGSPSKGLLKTTIMLPFTVWLATKRVHEHCEVIGNCSRDFFRGRVFSHESGDALASIRDNTAVPVRSGNIKIQT